MILFLSFILTFSAHAQIPDCGANLKSISADRPVFGVSAGKFVELARVERPIKKISVIVPVYREFANGNLARLMRTLSAQTLDPKLLEVVLVVNNSKKSAERADSVYAENQATLRWLNKNSFDFALKVLDQSTQGVEPNMGLVRQAGAVAAIDQNLPRDQQVLVFMDADTEFRADHLARLREAYQNFQVDVVLSRIQFEVRDPRNLKSFLSHPAYHAMARYSMFRRALSYAQQGAGTPQISALAEGFLAVGGFAPVSHGEDIILMRALGRLKTYFPPNLVVITEDRAREDGFDAAHRFEWNKNFEWSEPFAPDPILVLYDVLRPLQDRQTALIAKRQVSPSTAVNRLHKELGQTLGIELSPTLSPDIFADHEISNHPEFDEMTMAAIFDYFFEYRSSRPGLHSALIVNSMTDLQASEKFNDELKRRRLVHRHAITRRRDFLRAWLNGRAVQCDSADIFIRFFCAPSSALRELFVKLRHEYAGEDDAMEGLTKLFPDFLGPWLAANFINDSAMLELGEGLVLSGYHDPDQVQGLQKLLR